MFKPFFKLMNEETGGEAQTGGGSPLDFEAPPTEGQTTPSNDPAPTDDPIKQVWGDMADKIKFPEGFADEFKANAGLKPFFTKEGEFNPNALAKSYLHTKSMVGNKNTVVIPGENATEEERADFFKKLGHVEKLEDFKIELPENSKVSKELAEGLKGVLHKNYVSPKVAGELVKLLEEQTAAGERAKLDQSIAKVKAYNETLQKEYGQAFGHKAAQAKQLIKETLGLDESAEELKIFSDPMIGSNPVVFRLISKLADSAYAEDNSGGSKGGGMGVKSPSEAMEEINRIMGDKDDAYHKPSHPAYKDRQQYMLSLYRAKNAVK